MSLDTDKRLAQYNIRIPEILKHDLEKLTSTQIAKLNDDILIVMARAVHEAKFDPLVYLNSMHNLNQG